MPESPSTVSRLDFDDARRQALAQLAAPSESLDLRDVLARTQDLEPRALVDLLVLDQAQRYSRGQRVPVETYLRLCPALGEDTDEAFELVYSEFVLRQELGDDPPLAEYVWRFPQFADRLRRQADLFQTLVAAEDQTPFTPSVQIQETRPQPALSSAWPRINGFAIEGELGRGGMAVVYQARQLSLNRTVALKLIRDGALADADQRKRFQREAESVARLQHPNIVQIHAIGEQDGLPYLCLEYVAGGSLARALQGTPQPPPDAARLVETLARAVEYAHRQGIVHRDLKPANILLQAIATDEHRLTQMKTPEEEANSAIASSICVHQCSSVANSLPKIADFGLAKRWHPDEATASSHSGAIVGTAEYMAPEQAQATPNAVGPAADIYALGVILYELLTGRPPFKAAVPLDTLLLVLQEEPVPPRRLQPGVPRDLETICLKCLEKSPRRRYATAEELADDLHRFLAGEPIRARPVRGWEHALKWTRRRPAMAALIGVSVAAVLALAALGLWHNFRLTREVQEANRQRERADGNLRKALAVMPEALPLVPDDRAGSRPQLDEAQRQRLQKLIQFCQEILKEPENVTREARHLQGQARYNLGRVHLLLGDNSQAVPHLEEAVAVQQALLDEFPGERTYREDLANSTFFLGNATSAGLDHQEALFEKTLELLGPLARENSENAALIHQQLVIRNSMCSLHMARKQPAQALAALLHAAELGEALVQRAPDHVGYRITLAHSCVRLGLLYSQAEEREKARESLHKSLTLLEPHAKAEARNEIFAVALAQTYNMLALLAEHTGKPAERRDWGTRSIQTLEAVLRPESRDYRVRLLLAQAHGSRGVALENLGQPGEAVADFERLVELTDGPMRPRYRSLLASVLVDAGHHARATAEAQALAEAAGKEGPLLYDLASVYARAVKAAQQDHKLSAATQTMLVEQYGQSAVALLEQAHRAGLFNDPKQVQRLEKGDAFAALRRQPAFARFLRELGANKLGSPPARR